MFVNKAHICSVQGKQFHDGGTDSSRHHTGSSGSDSGFLTFFLLGCAAGAKILVFVGVHQQVGGGVVGLDSSRQGVEERWGWQLVGLG